jgi:hypothetical protein
VIGLGESIPGDFPVALQNRVVLIDRSHRGERKAAEPGGMLTDELVQGLFGGGIEADENEAFLSIRRDRREAVLTFIESEEEFFLRDAH